MAIKGYVVRGTHRRGWPVFAYDHSGAFGGPSETDIPLHVFPSLDTASGGRAHMVRCGCSDVAIFRLHPDGREERLPSYEEALGEIEAAHAALDPVVSRRDAAADPPLLLAVRCATAVEIALEQRAADPLAALEAAERRLLEAGGWTPVPDEDYRGYWRDRDGRMCKQAVAILQERRRLAAKGGV